MASFTVDLLCELRYILFCTCAHFQKLSNLPLIVHVCSLLLSWSSGFFFGVVHRQHCIVRVIVGLSVFARACVCVCVSEGDSIMQKFIFL